MRKAIKEDIPAIVELCTLLHQSDNYKHHTFDVDYIYKSLENNLSNQACDIIIVEKEGRVIGAACGVAHPTFLCPEMEYSELFVVCSDPRGTIRLLNELERLARQREVVRMNIGSSTADNPRYCTLLEKKGFSPFGRAFRKVL